MGHTVEDCCILIAVGVFLSSFFLFFFSNICVFYISLKPLSFKTHSVWQKWGIMKLDMVRRQEKVLSELLHYRASVKVMISYVSGSLYVKIVFIWEISWKENDEVISLTPGGEMPVQTSLPIYSSLLRILTIVSLRNSATCGSKWSIFKRSIYFIQALDLIYNTYFLDAYFFLQVLSYVLYSIVLFSNEEQVPSLYNEKSLGNKESQ